MKPFLTHSDSYSDIFGDHDNDSEESKNLRFGWDNSIFLGKTLVVYDKLKLNLGINSGYEFRWSDREGKRSDERWLRQWDEENQFKIGVTFRPSLTVFKRVILETDYGIQYTGKFTESKSELGLRSRFPNQIQKHTQHNSQYSQDYGFIGRSFSLDMGLKVYLKI